MIKLVPKNFPKTELFPQKRDFIFPKIDFWEKETAKMLDFWSFLPKNRFPKTHFPKNTMFRDKSI
jgi:hypothetical protein